MMKKIIYICFISLFFVFISNAATFENFQLTDFKMQNANDFFHDNPLFLFQGPENNYVNISNQENFVVNASFKPITKLMVQNILKRYKEIPGGITLEGNAIGLPNISKISFIPKENIFLINNNISFNPELSQTEIKDIFYSIYKDDNIGISIGTKNVIYGGVKTQGLVSTFLNFADHYLGSIVFASARWVYSHSLPAGYIPKRDFNAGVTAVYFNFYDFIFSIDNNNIKLNSLNMDATLIPLIHNKIDKDVFDPDYKIIERSTFSKSFEDNLKHIISNFSVYINDVRLKKVIAYGKTAAFARFLRDNNINYNNFFNK